MNTPDKRVEEIVKSIKPNIRWREDMGGFAKKECENVIEQLWEIQEKKLRTTLTQYHQDLIDDAVEELEEMKRDQDAPKPDDPHFTGCGGCGGDYPAICGCREVNQALTEAQTIIKSK